MNPLCINLFLFLVLFLSSSVSHNDRPSWEMIDDAPPQLFFPGSVAILPNDGRQIFFEAFAAAKREIRIEICVLEDPLILQSLMQALGRGIKVKVIVDRGKYEALPSEQANLALYLTSAGGKLHLSNPIFPKSFPKVILIDNRYVLVGSACLDTTTFMQYRDYVYVSADPCIIKYLSELFSNDWLYSAQVGAPVPPFNPTPPISDSNIVVSPVNSAKKLVRFIQNARRYLDLTSELLGNPTLESELVAAVRRGVNVRIIAPEIVNEATVPEQALQISSLNKLKAAGVHVHVTKLPESMAYPYMHARMAVADETIAYLGSISLSPESPTFNREVGLILNDRRFVNKLGRQFEIDYTSKSVAF